MRTTSTVQERDGGGNDAAAAVLTDSMLFRCVAASQSGYPQAVAELVKAASEEELQSARRDLYTYGDKGELAGVLPRLAIMAGDLQMLKLLFDLKTREQYQNDPMLKFVDVMQTAVLLESVEVLDCLAELKDRDPAWQWETHLLSTAVDYGGGDVRVLEWLHRHLPQDMRVISQYNIDEYAHQGGIELARWFHEHGYNLRSVTADRSASSGQLDVIEYLYEHTDVRCSPEGIVSAALKGFVDIVKIVAVDQTEEACAAALNAAAYSGHLEAVQYFIEHESGVSSRNAVDKAALGGHQNIVSYLLEHLPDTCTSRAMESAVAHNRLDILTLLHENQATGWTPSLMDGAAARGYFDIVKFLHENRREGCTTAAMDDAAARGHLSVVQFLHEHRTEGCTTKAMDEAAKNSRLDIVKFLHESRSEGCTAKAMDAAAARGHLEVVKFLNEHRSEASRAKALQRAVVHRQLAVADFLCTHLSESDVSAAMTLATTSANVTMINLLYKHPKAQAFAYAALKAAAQKQRSRVVKFLCENQAHEAHGYPSFLKRAVEEDVEWLVEAVLPYSSLADVTEARATTATLNRDGDPHILLLLENCLGELS